jgi:parvulin-like peptidyl-prolyl isomerase
LRTELLATIGLLLFLVVSAAISAPVATVNGVPISNEDYVAALETTPVQVGQIVESAGAAAFERLVSEIVLSQLAEKEGVPVTDEQIDVLYKAAEKDGSLTQIIKQRSMTADEVRYELKAKQALINLATKGVQVTDGEVQDYYFKNKDKYQQPRKTKIAIIMAKDPKKIAQAAARVKKGEDFGLVAKQMSEDTVSKDGGGVLGWVWPNQVGVPPIICNTALNLKVGGVSNVIKVQDQLVIIKAMDRSPATSVPLSEVKETIRESIAIDRGVKSKELQQKIHDAEKAAIIDIKVDRYKDLDAVLKERLAAPK